MNDLQYQYELKKHILNKLGVSNLNSKDCKILSETIFKETKNYISETTLKRFFGFAKANHHFSKFTISSLSKFLGFNDWNHFKKSIAPTEQAPISDWVQLKSRINNVTFNALVLNENSSGFPQNLTVERKYLYSDFDYFLKSKYKILTVSAPPKHGKTALCTQLIKDKLFKNENQSKSDIYFLINCNAYSLTNFNIQIINQWLYNYINFNSLQDLINYYQNNPHLKEGKIILFIDNVETLLNTHSDFQNIKTLIDGLPNNDFLKLIFITTSETRITLESKFELKNRVNKFWYKGLHFDKQSFSNIPLLNTSEIETVLSQIENEKVSINFVYPLLQELFKTPFWLKEYYNIKTKYNFSELNNPLLAFEMISVFIKKNIYLSNNSTEKKLFAYKLAQTMYNNNYSKLIYKEDFIDKIKANLDIYNELIQSGIIRTNRIIENEQPKEFIEFTNDIILSYFLHKTYLKKSKLPFAESHFLYILKNFKYKEAIILHTLKWIFREIIKSKNYINCDYFFNLPFNNEIKSKILEFILKTSKFEISRGNLKLNKVLFNSKRFDMLLMSHSFNSLNKELNQILKEKIVDENLQINLSLNQSLLSIYDLNEKDLSFNLLFLKRVYANLEQNYPVNPYDLLRYFQLSLQQKDNNNYELDLKINKHIAFLKNNNLPINQNLNNEEILSYKLIIMKFKTEEKNSEILEFTELLFKRFKRSFYNNFSTFSPFLINVYGQTLLKLGKLNSAFRILQFYERLYKNETLYFTYRDISFLKLFRALFYNHTGQFNKSIELSIEGINYIKEKEVKFNEVSFYLNKIDCLKQLDNLTESSNAIIELNELLTNHKIKLPNYMKFHRIEFDEVFEILKNS